MPSQVNLAKAAIPLPLFKENTHTSTKKLTECVISVPYKTFKKMGRMEFGLLAPVSHMGMGSSVGRWRRELGAWHAGVLLILAAATKSIRWTLKMEDFFLQNPILGTEWRNCAGLDTGALIQAITGLLLRLSIFVNLRLKVGISRYFFQNICFQARKIKSLSKSLLSHCATDHRLV